MRSSVLKAVDLKLLKSFFTNSFRDTLFLKKEAKRIQKEKVKDQEDEDLLYLLRLTKTSWNDSIINYEYATDEEMIDYYTYQIKAQEMRFKYLLKKAKEQGIKAKAYKGL